MINYTGVVPAVSGGGGSAIVAGAAVDVNLVLNQSASFAEWAIPAGVRRITLLLDRVLVVSGWLVQMGTSAGVLFTGYSSTSIYVGASNGVQGSATSGLQIPEVVTSNASLIMVFDRCGTDNSWVSIGQSLYSPSYLYFTAGRISLPGELTRFRVQTSSGFSVGGTMQLLWEF